jgi:hypothetical protein
MIKNKIVLLIIATVLTSSAFAADEFKITPKVDLESGYVTKTSFLGLENQKNSAYVSGAIALDNSIVTPKVGVTYFFNGEGSDQTVLDASLNKNISLGSQITLSTSGGVQKRILQTQNDSLFAYGKVKLEKLWVVTKLATPYVVVGKDLDQDLFGVTVGLDRTFTVKKFEFTPRAEMYTYDNYKSYLAGGTLAYTGIKYVKPFADVSYCTTDSSARAKKLDGDVLATIGVKFNF